MNKPTPIKKRASLLERAADAFDFNALLRRDPDAPAAPVDPDSRGRGASHAATARRTARSPGG